MLHLFRTGKPICLKRIVPIGQMRIELIRKKQVVDQVVRFRSKGRDSGKVALIWI